MGKSEHSWEQSTRGLAGEELRPQGARSRQRAGNEQARSRACVATATWVLPRGQSASLSRPARVLEAVRCQWRVLPHRLGVAPLREACKVCLVGLVVRSHQPLEIDESELGVRGPAACGLECDGVLQRCLGGRGLKRAGSRGGGSRGRGPEGGVERWGRTLGRRMGGQGEAEEMARRRRGHGEEAVAGERGLVAKRSSPPKPRAMHVPAWPVDGVGSRTGTTLSRGWGHNAPRGGAGAGR